MKYVKNLLQAAPMGCFDPALAETLGVLLAYSDQNS